MKNIEYSINHSYYLSCYISILNKSHELFIDSSIKKYNLNQNQYKLLIYVHHNEGAIQGVLASICGIDKFQASKSFRVLEDRKLIKKHLDEDNRRSYKLYLTDKGKKVAEELIAKEIMWEESICNKLEIKKEKLLDFFENLCIGSLDE